MPAIVAITAAFCLAALGPETAAAQAFDLTIGGEDMTGEGGSFAGRAVQLLGLITVLSIAPALLIMVTAFTRIIVALALLRSALGLQQTPPNMVLVGLALFLTAFVMAPVFDDAWRYGVQPMIDEAITEEQALKRTYAPFKNFMMANVRNKDLALFKTLAAQSETGTDTPRGPFPAIAEEPQSLGGGAPTAAEAEAETPGPRTLIAAFIVSELRRAFEIGFLLFLPFLVIEMVVATVLMSMGMMMLPPVIISLPFKLIFFVLIDGWHLVAGSMVRSFTGV